MNSPGRPPLEPRIKALEDLTAPFDEMLYRLTKSELREEGVREILKALTDHQLSASNLALEQGHAIAALQKQITDMYEYFNRGALPQPKYEQQFRVFPAPTPIQTGHRVANTVSGSRKGIPNKIGAAVKSNVIAVFDRIGGRDGMAAWAQENLTEFYRLYARLIPTESSTEITFRDATELTRAELLAIATGGGEGDIEAPGRTDEPSELH